MSKEIYTGPKLNIDFLARLLGERDALFILQFANNAGRPVNHEELHTSLNKLRHARNQKEPSEREVRRRLGFLTGRSLLEVVGKEYQITPRGVNAVELLMPTATGSVKT